MSAGATNDDEVENLSSDAGDSGVSGKRKRQMSGANAPAAAITTEPAMEGDALINY
jgi:hypothetical protein